MLSRMKNLRGSDLSFSFAEEKQSILASTGDAPKFLALEDVRKIFASPTIITTESLRRIGESQKIQDFFEILEENGGRYYFKKAIYRDKFFKFIDDQLNDRPKNESNSSILFLYENDCKNQVLKFKTISKIDRSFIIALSVIELRPIRSFEPKILRDLFGLTLAESKIAICLHNGLTVNDAADQVGVRISTVRDQLTSIFAKTSTSRQSELVSILSRLEQVLV